MTLWRNLVVALVAAFALAACSSSDNGTDTGMTEPPTTMEPEPTPEEQIAELQGQINALRAELGLDPIDINGLTGSVSDLQGQVDDLNQQITERDEAIADAAAKAMTAKGKAIYDVLDPLAADGAPSQTAISPVASAPAVAANYGSAAGLTVTAQKAFVDGLDTALTGITATDNDAYESSEAGVPARLAANDGFSGTMLSWDDSGRTDTMTVYTDVSAPSGQLFSEAYGGGTQSIASSSGAPLEGAQTGVTGTAFDGRTGGTVAHTPNAKSTADQAENNVVKLSGSYKGAAGSYTCTPASPGACTSMATPTTITFSDNWTFTANTGAMVSVPDSNGYIAFGWWMRDDKTTASPLDDNVAVFYNANAGGGTALADITALTGVANYEGGAAGKYAWRDVDEGSAHGGHFTAKANLTASFGATDTLSGSISDFRIGDDGMDPDWTVTLSGAGLSSAGAVVRGTGATAATTVWAVGSNTSSSMGGWEALLSGTGAERNDNLPTGVAGAFDGMFGEQGRMVGAFGANITNANPPK